MKIKYVIIVIVFSQFLAGCHYFIPGPIKRQTSLVNLDVQTALEEIYEIQKDTEKSEEQKMIEIKEKSIIVLERLKPQVQNINDYAHGRPSSD